jgi:phage anti-repressor protein
MQEIIKIQENNGKQAVSARELHGFLGVDTIFANWIKRMFEYGFDEGKDFIPILEKNPRGRPSADYALSLNCAKEIAMIQRTPKGKQAREYFIACEEKLREVSKPLSTIDILKLSIQKLEEQEAALAEVRSDIKELRATTQTRPDYFTVVGYASLNGISVGLHLAARVGRKCSTICKSLGYDIESIPDPRFGRVNMYPKDVLEDVFTEEV